MRILVTGAAGFIGYHVAERLLAEGHRVVGLDIVSPYYDPALKEARLARLQRSGEFSNYRIDLTDRSAVEELFDKEDPEVCVHLAAQAGVRHSLEHPLPYVQSNVEGFLHILEGCRHHDVAHLIFASTSSVYGASGRTPFSIDAATDHPLTLYAATKKANELMAHAYAHLFGIRATGVRFFTVYGPWGRPDMALFLFTRAILEGKPIEVFNNGRMTRDFTYVDDVVEGIVRLVPLPPERDAAWTVESPRPGRSGVAPFRMLNLGGGAPQNLLRYIEVLEDRLGRLAEKRLLPMQPGDVRETWADTSETEALIGELPQTPLATGVGRFVDWYLSFYGTGR